MDPAIRVTDVLRVHGETRSEGVAAPLGDLPEAIQVGPGAFRIHVVGGDRRDAAPVVDARIQKGSEVV